MSKHQETVGEMFDRIQQEMRSRRRSDREWDKAWWNLGVAIGVGIDEDAAAECENQDTQLRVTRYAAKRKKGALRGER